MPVTIDQLTEGYWWADSPWTPGSKMIVELLLNYRKEKMMVWIHGNEVEKPAHEWLDRLIAPVAPYRETNTLVVVGWLGNKSAYLNVPREEAIARFKKDNEDDDEPDDVLEFTFTDEFWVYDASGAFD